MNDADGRPATGFADLLLPAPLLRGLARAGWTTPTPVQAAVIPPALTGVDLMVTAATGSGKTGAFLLPMMTRFVDQPDRRGGTRGLVLVPTRELARQVREHFMALAGHTRLTVAVITGGEPRGHQVAALRRNPDLLIGTPGRLLEHLGTGELALSELIVLVLDEADRMLDLGLGGDVLALVGACNPARQTLLFSATLEHRGLVPMLRQVLHDPETIVVDRIRAGGHRDIRHQLILADDPPHKQRLLAWLLTHEDAGQAQGSVLVFANTRAGACELANALVDAGVRTALLHGQLEQRERKRVLGLFQRGEVRVLVATDVAARGLDIPAVGLVINAEPPLSGTDYLHRTGRTGRAGAQGVAISLVAAADWNRMESIARYLALELEPRSIEGLAARWQGPTGGRKPKSAAKKAAARKGAGQPAGKGATGADAAKPKERHRDRKNIGKRRQPSAARPDAADASTAPGPGTTAGTPRGSGGGERPPRRRSRQTWRPSNPGCPDGSPQADS